MMHFRKGLWIPISAILVFFAFGIFIWPGLYRYTKVEYTGAGSLPVRINRVTHSTWILGLNGWVLMKESDHPDEHGTTALDTDPSTALQNRASLFDGWRGGYFPIGCWRMTSPTGHPGSDSEPFVWLGEIFPANMEVTFTTRESGIGNTRISDLLPRSTEIKITNNSNHVIRKIILSVDCKLVDNTTDIKFWEESVYIPPV